MSERLTDGQLSGIVESYPEWHRTRRAAAELVELRALSMESIEWLDTALGMVDRGDGPPNWDGIRAHLALLRTALSVQP